MTNKKTLIVGSSGRPGRYAYQAAMLLKENNIDFIPMGIREGEVFGETILNINDSPKINGIHTITMYVSAPRQKENMAYLLGLNPQRIIFNPGAENSEFAAKAIKKGIIVEQACTLVLLRTRQF